MLVYFHLENGFHFSYRFVTLALATGRGVRFHIPALRASGKVKKMSVEAVIPNDLWKALAGPDVLLVGSHLETKESYQHLPAFAVDASVIFKALLKAGIVKVIRTNL